MKNHMNFTFFITLNAKLNIASFINFKINKNRMYRPKLHISQGTIHSVLIFASILLYNF